jgi:hypothetical protein
LFNFALGYFVPPAFQNIQWKVYIIFGVFCVAMSIHVFLVFPETAGKTLEEVESMFAENVPAWKTRVGRTTKDSELPPESNGTVPQNRSGSKSPELDLVSDEKEV